MPGRMPRRPVIAIAALSIAAAGAVGCGQQKGDHKEPGTTITTVAPEYQAGAKLFVERCSGCHSMGIVGAEGGALKVSNRERVDGPNFNVRKEDKQSVLFAIRNGGFSGAIMPANVVTGRQAEKVADFLDKYSGKSN